MNIAELLNPSRPVPPQLPSDTRIPPLLVRGSPDELRPWVVPPPPTDESEDPDVSRSNPYTVADDLLILKVASAYFGATFRGKIPWSFWQTYKRVTGSSRSTSSLYHHWNGAIKKKYDAFLSAGRLSDCILWLETAVMTEERPPLLAVPTGAPLRHSDSEPPVPLDRRPRIGPDQPHALIRTTSMSMGTPAQFILRTDSRG
jgi:hypothetical protein